MVDYNRIAIIFIISMLLYAVIFFWSTTTVQEWVIATALAVAIAPFWGRPNKKLLLGIFVINMALRGPVGEMTKTHLEKMPGCTNLVLWFSRCDHRLGAFAADLYFGQCWGKCSLLLMSTPERLLLTFAYLLGPFEICCRAFVDLMPQLVKLLIQQQYGPETYTGYGVEVIYTYVNTAVWHYYGITILLVCIPFVLRRLRRK